MGISIDAGITAFTQVKDLAHTASNIGKIGEFGSDKSVAVTGQLQDLLGRGTETSVVGALQAAQDKGVHLFPEDALHALLKDVVAAANMHGIATSLNAAGHTQTLDDTFQGALHVMASDSNRMSGVLDAARTAGQIHDVN